MKKVLKYYWLGYGALVGVTTVMLAYQMLNLLVVDDTLNWFAAVGVVVIYAAVTYLASLLYEKLNEK